MLKNVFQVHITSVLGPFPVLPGEHMCMQLKKESGLIFNSWCESWFYT